MLEGKTGSSQDALCFPASNLDLDDVWVTCMQEEWGAGWDRARGKH